MTGGPWHAPVRLSGDHRIADFASGKHSLDDWLRRFALQSQASGMASTYVTADPSGVVGGYYALATGGVSHKDAPERTVKGTGRYDIPVVLLARLAVDRSHQAGGIGRSLLRDALLRTSQVADSIGVRALLVHCLDGAAKSWYLRQADFDQSPTDPMHLLLLTKDLRGLLRAPG